MKKFLIIFFLIFIFYSHNVFAEIIKFNCLIYPSDLKNIAFESRKDAIGKIAKLNINTETNEIINKSDSSLNIFLGVDDKIKYDLKIKEKKFTDYKVITEYYTYEIIRILPLTTTSGTKDFEYKYIASLKRVKNKNYYQTSLRTLSVRITVNDNKMESMYVRLNCPDKEITADQISKAKKDISDKELLAQQKKEKEKNECIIGIKKGTTNAKCIKKWEKKYKESFF